LGKKSQVCLYQKQQGKKKGNKSEMRDSGRVEQGLGGDVTVFAFITLFK